MLLHPSLETTGSTNGCIESKHMRQIVAPLQGRMAQKHPANVVTDS